MHGECTIECLLRFQPAPATWGFVTFNSPVFYRYRDFGRKRLETVGAAILNAIDTATWD
jgi:hypothetical protein